MNLAFGVAGSESGDLPRLPGSLQLNRRLARWLHFLPDGMIEVRSGKVEIGQGILTALAQIAAEELDVTIGRIRMVSASTADSPDEAVTSGSRSIQDSGSALRYACAEARAIYLAAAAARLGVPAESLTVTDGEITSAGGARSSYAELADDALLEREATASAQPKAASQHRIVGTPLPRLDLAQKICGQPCFVHDLKLPGMLHARVLRPPSPAAALISLDDTKARALPGVVAVLRDGSFVGVLAEREEIALKALAALQQGAAWREAETLPDASALGEWLTAQPSETQLIAERGISATASAARTHRARYTRPYLAHASIAPSCALAQWNAGRLHVWSHSQGIYNLRADLALALALPPEHIVVEHVEGAGCYGHNGADDAAFDAALLARAAGGRPVRLQWTRADELSWAPFGPAMTVEIEADLDAAGAILAWRHEIWSNGHSSRPGRARRRRCSQPPNSNSHPSARSRSTPRLRRAAAPTATPCRAMICRPGAYSATGCSQCRSAPRRCARSARSPMCSRSNRFSMNSRPNAAWIRSPIACGSCPSRARAPCSKPPRNAQTGPDGSSAKATATASAWRATRAAAPGAQWSRRSKPGARSA